jgi:hypothetical protein
MPLWKSNKNKKFNILNRLKTFSYNLRQNGKSFPVAKKYFPGCGATGKVIPAGTISFSEEFCPVVIGNVE